MDIPEQGERGRPAGRWKPVIPRGEVPCVWMTGGVLTFRLCDRGLECAECPLDRALRNAPDVTPARPTRTRSGSLLPDGLFYHPDHCWIRLEVGGELTVGVNDLTRRLLGRPEEVTLPEEGRGLGEGHTAVRVRSRGVVVEIPSPFDGTVVRVNEALVRQPALLHGSPFGDGWLYRATAAEPSRVLASQLTGDAARLHLERVEDRARTLIDFAAGTGACMNDGGTLDEEPLAGLPRKVAARILSSIYRTLWKPNGEL